MAKPKCPSCQQAMRKRTKGTFSTVIKLIVTWVIAVLLIIFIPVLGWIVGAILILISFWYDSTKIWKCPSCKMILPRA